MLKIKKHIKPGQCATSYCRNRTSGGKHCSTCRSKKSRQQDPVKYAYTALKNNAKRRGVLFTITLDQFRDWCVKVKYIGFAGRLSESYTIDRRYNDIGYHIDNIQVLTKRNNVIKYFSYDYRSKTPVFSEKKKRETAEQDYF